MMRGKRGLDSGDLDDVQPEAKKPKVPALASVIVEALKVDSLQKLCSSLEPILRRVDYVNRELTEKIDAFATPSPLDQVDINPTGLLNWKINFNLPSFFVPVSGFSCRMFAIFVYPEPKLGSKLVSIFQVSEEVERALAKLGPAKLSARSSPKQIEGPNGRNLQLHFRSCLALPLFTGAKVEGEQGAAIHVVLLDANTGCVVTTGLESSARLDVVVLEGDFNNEDDDDWTHEDFESHVVKEREGKRPLLTGDLQVSLKEGVGTLGDLTFTDNSSWIRSRKFRLGLKVAPGYCDGIHIREAKTDAFTVKDHRGELYKKHYPPALNDDVWRLEKIGKDGSFHKKLNQAGIYSVEDFLRLVVRDSQRLRSVLGSGMSNKMWESLVEHAKTCVLSGKHYVYYPDDTRTVGVVFNNIYELRGLIASGQYCPAETLNDNQKVLVDTLVKKAYDNWFHVIEYDGRALLSLKQSKTQSVSHKDSSAGSSDYQSVDQQMSLPRLPVSIPPEPAAGDTGLAVGENTVSSGFIESLGARYQNPQHVAPSAQVQYDTNGFVPQNQLITSSHQNQILRNDSVGLALGPPQSSGYNFQPVAGASGQMSSNLNSYDDWSRQRDTRGLEDYFSEEEIRMRSNEMLENEDMQHLLRIFSMGGTAPANVSDEGYPFSTYMPTPSPNFTFEDDRSRSSGKAVVGWLKLKAALRWGIFIRKRAAEKRAQLVELDD